MAKATKVRTVEGITEYQLDNGLQVLLFPDRPQSTVTVNVTYLVGSRLEGYGETGMAHLLEHMMFKGSPRHRNVLKLARGEGRPAQRLDRRTTARTTSRRCPRRRTNLDWALDLEADRMVNAEVSADDLKTEFSVVRNEFENGENSPTNILARARVVDRVPLAQLRQVDDRLARRHRARAGADAARVLREVLPARQRDR